PGDLNDGVLRNEDLIISVDPLIGGDDTINGMGGDDILVGGVNRDVINGNGGNNIVFGDNGVVDFFIADGNNDDIDRIETIFTDIGGNDTITDNGGDDIIFAGDDGDIVGNEVLTN